MSRLCWKMLRNSNVLVCFTLFWVVYTFIVYAYLPYVREDAHKRSLELLAVDKVNLGHERFVHELNKSSEAPAAAQSEKDRNDNSVVKATEKEEGGGNEKEADDEVGKESKGLAKNKHKTPRSLTRNDDDDDNDDDGDDEETEEEDKDKRGNRRRKGGKNRTKTPTHRVPGHKHESLDRHHRHADRIPAKTKTHSKAQHHRNAKRTLDQTKIRANARNRQNAIPTPDKTKGQMNSRNHRNTDSTLAETKTQNNSRNHRNAIPTPDKTKTQRNSRNRQNAIPTPDKTKTQRNSRNRQQHHRQQRRRKRQRHHHQRQAFDGQRNAQNSQQLQQLPVPKKQTRYHRKPEEQPKAKKSRDVKARDVSTRNKARNVQVLNQTQFLNDSIVYPKYVEVGPPDGPGEGGKGVEWRRQELSPEDRKEWDAGYKHNSFNQFISDRISVHRTLQDPRPPQCKDAQYPSNLPSCSVVIIFHNEAWSALLRSVHSVLTHTPSHLLTSVILVDDKSTMGHLGRPLEKYFRQYPKVQILRGEKRGGLTRARLLGFKVVTSEVVVFLDSHIECTSDWYQPLVLPILKDYRAVTFPIIDIIDDNTLTYVPRHSSDVGGLVLSTLVFTWMSRQASEDPTLPVRSPTMPGGLFAISRRWFQELGTYDPGLEYWGGENIELSFKTWMCNGSIFTIPCSHVGHIFRKTNPIPWGIGNPILKNSLRVASVWMDHFKDYFLETLVNKKGLDFGDVSSRKALREKLHCNDFRWYIGNVFPELRSQIDNTAPYSGEIRNQASAVCVDSAGQETPIVYPCHGLSIRQFWFLTAAGLLKQQRKYLVCRHGKLKITRTTWRSPEWSYQRDGSLLHVPTGRCLQAGTDGKTLSLALCRPSPWQRWTMQPRAFQLLQPL